MSVAHWSVHSVVLLFIRTVSVTRGSVVCVVIQPCVNVV